MEGSCESKVVSMIPKTAGRGVGELEALYIQW